MIVLSYIGDASEYVSIKLPLSKSILNRELILVADQPHRLPDAEPSWPEDSIRQLDALRSDNEIIDLHAAGTAMRFSTAYFSCSNKEVVLTGTERMKSRPIGPLIKALNELGAAVNYMDKEGFPPIGIKPATSIGGSVTIKGNISSQFISALLLNGHRMDHGLELKLEEPVTSRPYIDLTLSILQKAGITVGQKQNTYTISPQKIDKKYSISGESDWSAAAYFYGMVALGSPKKLILTGLSSKSMQGDKALAQYFEALGVKTSPIAEGVKLDNVARTTSSLELDLKDHPDLAQPIAFTCAGLGIDCHLSGLETLKIKETDRLLAMQETLTSLGPTVRVDHSSLTLSGKLNEQFNASLKSYDDHRMVMSYAIISSVVKELRIQDPQSVAKSFPAFWEELDSLGYKFRTAI